MGVRKTMGGWIPEMGEAGGYRWDTDRKRAMLARESARSR